MQFVRKTSYEKKIKAFLGSHVPSDGGRDTYDYRLPYVKHIE
jgi:hypothetical protein